MSNDSLKLKKQSASPDYLKRTGGVLLTFVSTIGLIFTAPLLLLGGLTGWLTGLFTKNNPLETSLTGAKIGSLGTLSALLFGLKLTQAMIEVSDISEHDLLLNERSEQPESGRDEESIEEQTLTLTAEPEEKLSDIKSKEEPVVVKTKEKPIAAQHQGSANAPQITRASTVPNIFFSKTEEKPESSKTSASHYFDHPEHIETFMAEVNALIAQNEAQAELKEEEEDLSKVAEQEITALVEIINNSTRAQNEFWNKLEKLSNYDIKLFVKRLSPMKAKRFSSSELDNLWRCFTGFESEPSKREFQSKKFAVMLDALSEEQLKASFESPDFLKILNKDHYVTAAANTLSRKQLELFASNSKGHDILNAMIKKLKPGPYTLGKLVSILPFATQKVKAALIDQLAHLACPASLNIRLTQLADHYIKVNNQIALKSITAAPSTSAHLMRNNTAPSKWTVHLPTKPVYSHLVVQKKEWAAQALDAFIAELNAEDYLIKIEKLFEELSSIPDHQIKIIVERASSPDFKNLLQHLWQIDSKTTNHLSYRENRSNRLRVVLETLSEEQLKSSLKENKFWEIFRNTQEPYGKMAAEVLSPRQFATIIAHASIDRHTDIAVLINQISKDSPAEKRRLHQILEAVIPYTTPWVVLALERQIKNLLSYDQDVSHRLNHDLKKYLKESLERPEVNMNYKRDGSLDKKSISLLLIEVESSHSHSLAM